jgi:hypothetical protein
MWPIQLVFLLFIVCRIILFYVTQWSTSFSHIWSNRSPPSFSSTTFQNFQVFLIYFPKCPTFSTTQSCAPNAAVYVSSLNMTPICWSKESSSNPHFSFSVGLAPSESLNKVLLYICNMQNTYNPKHTHNKQHKIWNSLSNLKMCLPVLYLWHLLESKLNKIENSYAEYTNKSADCLEGGCQQLVQQNIYLVSFSVFIVQEWWQSTLKFKCSQTWLSVWSHTHPTNMKFYYHWLMHGATSPCLHPHTAPVLTSCVTSILCTWSVSKWCDLIFLCLHSCMYSMLIAGWSVVVHRYCKAVLTWAVRNVSYLGLKY